MAYLLSMPIRDVVETITGLINHANSATLSTREWRCQKHPFALDIERSLYVGWSPFRLVRTKHKVYWAWTLRSSANSFSCGITRHQITLLKDGKVIKLRLQHHVQQTVKLTWTFSTDLLLHQMRYVEGPADKGSRRRGIIHGVIPH